MRQMAVYGSLGTAVLNMSQRFGNLSPAPGSLPSNNSLPAHASPNTSRMSRSQYSVVTYTSWAASPFSGVAFKKKDKVPPTAAPSPFRHDQSTGQFAGGSGSFLKRVSS